MAAAQCLHAALEHAHQHGQYPELPLAGQEEGEHRNAGVGRDADRDKLAGRILCAQPTKDQRRREGHDLRYQQGQQKAGGLQPQCRAVGGGHIDDGIHAVDVAEEGQQEPEHLLILAQMLEGVADAHKALPDGVLLYLHIVDLLIAPQQRQGGAQPPHSGDEQRHGKGGHLAQADGPAAQHQRQTHHKGHAAANVAPCIALRRHNIHAFRGGHIAQHGIVEHQTARKADLCKDEDDQERQPCSSKAHSTAACHAHEQAEHEDGLFKASGIGQRAQNRPQHCRDHRDHRACIAPVGQIVHRTQSPGLGQRIKENGHQRCDHQHKGRVAHIVQDP